MPSFARRLSRRLKVLIALWLVAVCAGDLTMVAVAQPDPPGAQTLRSLHAAVIPPRDRVDLARRILGVTDIPTPPTTPVEFEVGDTKDFNIANLDNNTSFRVRAKLLYETPHVYMWFETGVPTDAERIKQAAETFEAVIYPTVRRYFGTETSPGIDGDEHLYIVHARNMGRGVAGYFEGDSELPRVVAPRSNEHQMFFISLDAFPARAIGSKDYLVTLAHEFQHMIHANEDSNEQVWLDEGLSELAAALAVDGFEGSNAISFLRNPATQLNTWPALESSIPHYGGSYLFTAYFLHRFGEAALRDLVQNQADGLDGVMNTLRSIGAVDVATGQPITVDAFFADWVAANVLDDQDAARFTYSPPTELPTLAKTLAAKLDAPQSLALTQWGTTYLKLDNPPGSMRLRVEGLPTVRVLPTTPEAGRMFWWSNRGDQINTRLTRAFDLTGLSRATLRYQTWFAIERDWDYAYVMASTDGGATWAPLRPPDGVPGPDGNNNFYGPAYTGTSGGGGDDASTARWITQEIDLSAFAGQRILLRFEYITDEAVSEPGFAIDAISIPELGYSHDAESDDGGWQAEGWVRIDNVLPQRYLVQMIRVGTSNEVQRLLMPGDGLAGEWTLDFPADTAEVIFIFSGLTEFTTERAEMQYTLTSAR
jgi:hypothetical protein